MKAVVYDRYGPPDVLRIEEVERPVDSPLLIIWVRWMIAGAEDLAGSGK